MERPDDIASSGEAPPADVPAEEGAWVEALRREIPLLEHWIYMNTGTSGPSPRPVSEAQIEWIRRLERDGGGSPAIVEPLRALMTSVREGWTRILGAPSPETIALTHNTSEGIALIAAALRWREGDEVIVSELEHPSGLLPWDHLRRQHGIRVRYVRPQGGTLRVEDVEAAMTTCTRLLCFSHVSWNTGAVLPARELIELAASRGVLTLIDGAQSVGQLRLNMEELGCDFYAVPGQKWLLGPEGTGALYIRKERLETLTPPLIGWASFGGGPLPFEDEEAPLFHPDARRFEVATAPFVAVAGVEAAIRFMERFGMDRIASRIVHLARTARRRLAAVPGLRVWGADDPDAFSGLVAFTLEPRGSQAPRDPEEVVQYLFRQHRIVTRSIPYPPGVRLSLHAFNTEEEIEQAARALEAWLRENGSGA